MFHGHLESFSKNHLLEVRPNTKLGDHGTFDAHSCWFLLFYQVWGPAWIEIHWNSSWLRARSHMTSHYTWASVTTLHDFGGGLGTAFGHFILGSQHFMVTALGSCVSGPKAHFTHETEGMWPLHSKFSYWSKRLRLSKFTPHKEVKA